MCNVATVEPIWLILHHLSLIGSKAAVDVLKFNQRGTADKAFSRVCVCVCMRVCVSVCRKNIMHAVQPVCECLWRGWLVWLMFAALTSSTEPDLLSRLSG